MPRVLDFDPQIRNVRTLVPKNAISYHTSPPYGTGSELNSDLLYFLICCFVLLGFGGRGGGFGAPGGGFSDDRRSGKPLLLLRLTKTTPSSTKTTARTAKTKQTKTNT